MNVFLIKLESQNHSPDVCKLRLLTSGPILGHPLLTTLPGASPVAHQNSGWILPTTGYHQYLNTGERVIITEKYFTHVLHETGV